MQNLQCSITVYNTHYSINPVKKKKSSYLVNIKNQILFYTLINFVHYIIPEFYKNESQNEERTDEAFHQNSDYFDLPTIIWVHMGIQ